MASGLPNGIDLSEFEQELGYSGADTPAYRCQLYRDQLPLWRYLDDVADAPWLPRGDSRMGLSTFDYNKAQRYLPKEPHEDFETYRNRLYTSPYDDRFAQSLRKFTALLFSGGLEIYPENHPAVALLDNVDGRGTPLRSFIYDVAIAALRRGHTFVLADAPPGPPPRTAAEFRKSGYRPYLLHISPLDVINWRTEWQAQTQRLVQVTIKEVSYEAEGKFKEKKVTAYRTLRLIQGQTDEKGRPMPDFVEWVLYEDKSWTILGQGSIMLPYIPLFPVYGGLRKDWGVSVPTLRALADLNISLYQVTSDHRRKMHLCAMPVPVLRDSVTGDTDLVIGPGKFIHIRDPGGGFTWAEPISSSLSISSSEIRMLEAQIDQLNASYLQQPTDRQAAFTTMAMMGELDSHIEQFAFQIADGINTALGAFCDFMGWPESPQVILNAGVIKPPGTDSQLFLAYQNLLEKGFITPITFLLILQKLNFFPPNFDPVAEFQALEARKPPEPQFMPHPVLLETFKTLVQYDMLSKRTALKLLVEQGSLPPDLDIDEEIRRIGEDLSISGTSRFTAQPFKAPTSVSKEEVANINIGETIPPKEADKFNKRSDLGEDNK